jgi:hypothetical protein
MELTPEEAETLQQVLRSYLATLELEITHTDHSEFKAMLKRRRDLISRMVERLALPTTAAV